MLEGIQLKLTAIKQLQAFIGGGSVTANVDTLTPNQQKTLLYLKDEGICYLDPPRGTKKEIALLDANDRAGRFRFQSGREAKAAGLLNDLQKELVKK